jgi:hypothetical protein
MHFIPYLEQVTLAVLVCGWAHVLHAVYKPWGSGTAMYSLQHGSLGLTSFIFLMGLLFKVGGPSGTGGEGEREGVTHCTSSGCRPIVIVNPES